MPSLGWNAAFGLTNPLGARVDPYHGFNFLVEIEGIVAGGFSECTGLDVEIETHEYREGGVNDFVHRFGGATKYPPLLLKRGIAQIDGLWAWHQEIAQGHITRRNGTIYLLDKQHSAVMLWHFKQAFPIKWTGPELRAESSSVAFEQVQLTHRGLTQAPLTTARSGPGAFDPSIGGGGGLF